MNERIAFDPHPDGGFWWTCPGCLTREEDAWGSDGRGWAISKRYATTYCNRCMALFTGIGDGTDSLETH